MNWASDLPSTVNVSVVLVVNTDFRNHVDVHKLCYGPCGAIPNAVTIRWFEELSTDEKSNL